MKVWVLTSSRADYGIYYPLLRRIQSDSYFTLQIIAFGTHCSDKYGNTLDQIISDGFDVFRTIDCSLKGDSKQDIAESMAITISKFAALWNEFDGDLVFALGDRFEMFAAVTASVPFLIPIAHIHGGETTLGAIDNIFRHSITLISSFHFTANEVFSKRVIELTQNDKNVYNIGSLSLENIHKLQLFNTDEFYAKYSIDLTKPTILMTFHPETVQVEKNKFYIKEIIEVLKKLILNYQIVITLPNADTENVVVRESLISFGEQKDTVFLIESFGSKGYFSCMKYCSFVMGNSSSGIIESASLKKFNINLGDRQKGRLSSENTIHCQIDENEIMDAVRYVENIGEFVGENKFYKSEPSKTIIEIIKKNHHSE